MTDTQDTPDKRDEPPEHETSREPEESREAGERTETPYERGEQPGEEVERDPALGPPQTSGQPLPSGGSADPPTFPGVAGPGGVERELERSSAEQTAGPRQPPPESR